MAYKNFKLEDLAQKFGIENKRQRLFGDVGNKEPSQRLKDDLEEANTYLVRSEKAKCELIVSPILKELRRNNFDFLTFYSGENLNADTKKGLNGECDFIIAKNTQSYTISHPILQLVEAKRDDLNLGVAQCAAQMLGARLYNEHSGTPIDTIYGCVTNGNEWLFLKLSDKIYVDVHIYFISNLAEILAVFQNIIDYYKNILR